MLLCCLTTAYDNRTTTTHTGYNRDYTGLAAFKSSFKNTIWIMWFLGDYKAIDHR